MSEQQQLNDLTRSCAAIEKKLDRVLATFTTTAAVTDASMIAAQRQRTHISDGERAARQAEVEALADLEPVPALPLPEPERPATSLRLIRQQLKTGDDAA